MKKMNKKEKLKLTLTLLAALSGYEAAIAAGQYAIPDGNSIETTSENFDNLIDNDPFTIVEEKTETLYHYEVYGPSLIGKDGEEYPDILMYSDYVSTVPINGVDFDLKYTEDITTKQVVPKKSLINKINH